MNAESQLVNAHATDLDQSYYDVFDDRLLVHCVTREGAQAIEAGDANRRVAELTGK